MRGPSEERIKRQRALADWHDEWSQKHGVDLDNASPEQLAEYMRKADEIMGRDPDTGLRRGLEVKRRRRRHGNEGENHE